MLIAMLRDRGIWLFSDEIYRFLGQPIDGWAEPAAVAYEKGISLGVISKAYGLARLRVERVYKNKHVVVFITIFKPNIFALN